MGYDYTVNKYSINDASTQSCNTCHNVFPESDCQHRNLDINFIKVKVHAGNPGNELADELAKKGADCQVSHHIDFNYRSSKHRFFIFVVLPDEKHDQTFGIKYCQTKMLPDERHDQTFGIKCCQTKGMTRLLELSIIRRKT
ncbi:hypothetical protein RclHR1_23190005 [Rhizophagus clarus]|uniref:RNase H type-1 domain-containing protein n=1 Tax=Rhizophagus clarus TaxID=94130 RepID=A0A2Z6R8V0_9GLOM|nr:hypothetical protein RclHR1_23190005 [Rhizophagus clarus]